MFNNVFDTCGEPADWAPLETPPDAQGGVSEASQPDPVSEQASETVRGILGVSATLKVWAPNNLLLGGCQIETFAKGDGSHFFVVPTRIILHPGVRVEIEAT